MRTRLIVLLIASILYKPELRESLVIIIVALVKAKASVISSLCLINTHGKVKTTSMTRSYDHDEPSLYIVKPHKV
jgi:hypothetical protein